MNLARMAQRTYQCSLHRVEHQVTWDELSTQSQQAWIDIILAFEKRFWWFRWAQTVRRKMGYENQA